MIKNKEITKIFKDIKIEIKKGFSGSPCVFLDNIIRKDKPISKDQIKWMKPDRIDNSHFWKSIHEIFGTLAVTNIPNLSIKEANKRTLQLVEKLKILERVESKLSSNIKILEIGGGYGNFYDWLKSKNFNMDNYYSIDVYSYFFHENLYITDGNSFPKNLPKFDIIYSFNVFQHLTQNQRDMYYKNISKSLISGGFFYGGNIMKHPQNKDIKTPDGKSIWQMKDENGDDYVTFFGQYTKVEDSIGFLNKLRKLGLIPQLISGMGNYLSFEAKKPWTID